MNNILFKISLVFIAIIICIPVFAQGAPPATPIDGGLSLLLAAGGLYGVKKLIDSHKK